MDNNIKLDLSEEQLSNLIYSLQEVAKQVGVHDYVKLDINFEDGEIKVKRYNYRDLEFKVEL